MNYKRYSVWVYENSNPIQVFTTPKPNTREVWFEFYEFDYISWKLMELKCVEKHQTLREKISLYNFNKIKDFCLKYLLKETNLPITIIRDGEKLTDESYEEVIKIHPRILRQVLSLVEIFEEQRTKEEEKTLAKDCALIFGKNEGVVNPHPDIVLYCDLVAFWDKFGLNYFDIKNLPKELFYRLKNIMNLEASFKFKEQPKNVPQGNNKKIRF